jgi:hypothetical protein
MSDAPEHIWTHEDENRRRWFFKAQCGPQASLTTTKYVRADIAAARIAALEAERDEALRRRDAWRAKAEGYDAVRLALREKVGAPWPQKLSRLMWAGIAADEKKRADDAEAEVAKLNVAIKRLAGAALTLRAATLAEVRHIKDMDRANYIAPSVIEGEREANAILSAEIERLEAKVADLQDAFDAHEVDVSIGNGNLWRFWQRKAKETVEKNIALRADVAVAYARGVQVKRESLIKALEGVHIEDGTIAAFNRIVDKVMAALEPADTSEYARGLEDAAQDRADKNCSKFQ